ncbi:glycerophosphodiester phosphodiesterase [Idiomarina xiamenensis]|uniref:glycerophosphodiester phosphodiesterase n=1 Tax=Idiomarina xiamenensis 10-D-4 TaxID=740709 RepID=K2KYD2_9GAMM|nr:glycerophosphodiester phosphodiesterase [Idiomarina xiamenensis]EKE87574.1 glycerophosphodiester phosphodiesterase [Idiomarina xiamenensis 10-D-4]
MSSVNPQSNRLKNIRKKVVVAVLLGGITSTPSWAQGDNDMQQAVVEALQANQQSSSSVEQPSVTADSDQQPVLAQDPLAVEQAQEAQQSPVNVDDKDWIVIAHRGASGYLPEHTLAAAALAHGLGADYLEQDVQLSRDGVPVVLHDLTLGAVSNVADVFPERTRPDGKYYVLDFSVAELKQLRLHDRIDESTGDMRWPNRFDGSAVNFRIATLAEHLALLNGLNKTRDMRTGAYVEIKNAAWYRNQGFDVTAATMAALSRAGYLEPKGSPSPLYLQSFDPEVLRRLLREYHVNAPTVQLIGENEWNEADVDYSAMRSAAGLEALSNTVSAVGVWLPHVLKGVDENGQPQFTDLVKAAHRAGLRVHVYTARADQLPSGTPDYPTLIKWLQQAGVDGVFTDFPGNRVPAKLAAIGRASDAEQHEPDAAHDDTDVDQLPAGAQVDRSKPLR